VNELNNLDSGMSLCTDTKGSVLSSQLKVGHVFLMKKWVWYILPVMDRHLFSDQLVIINGVNVTEIINFLVMTASLLWDHCCIMATWYFVFSCQCMSAVGLAMN